MIYYKKRFGIRTADIFHDSAEKPSREVDVLSYYYVPERPKKSFFIRNDTSIFLDLTKTEEELFSSFNKTTKYQVNKAKTKDGVSCVTVLKPGENNTDAVNDFLNFYKGFAEAKRIPCLTIKNLEQYINFGTCCIRSVQKDNEVLSMHLYEVTENIAWMHRSCSLFRTDSDPAHKSLIGRANRFLHLENALFFKQMGLSVYNFGCLYTGHIDKELLLLNEFKESFGGDKKELYSYMIPVSFLGYLLILLRIIKYYFDGMRYKLSRPSSLLFRKKE